MQTATSWFSEKDEARKARSIAQLAAEGVPTIAHLPPIGREGEGLRRDKEEVVRRAIALAIVAAKGETNDYDIGQALIEQFNAREFFTPKEQTFLGDRNTSDRDRVNFVWRYEGVHIMLWALGIIPELGRPDKICDVQFIANALREFGVDGLGRRANLRSQAQLFDAADLIYRYHWAVRNARLKGQRAPANLEAGVVYERHHALNWLIGYMNQDWDDVSTDT